MSEFGVYHGYKNQALEIARQQIEDENFKNRHRKTAKAFTRVCSLLFALTLVLRS